MEIIKTKGLPDKYLWKDQKTKLIDLKPKLKRLPKSREYKKVFYRACPIFGRRLIHFPPTLEIRGFLPKEFVGDILLDSKDMIESVLVKYVLINERVIPVHEWVKTAKEIFQRRDILLANFPDRMEERLVWEEQINAIMLELESQNVVRNSMIFYPD